MIDLSASMNPFAPDVNSLAAQLVRGRRSPLDSYPDGHAATDALASAIGVPAERLVLTNGGSEAIALVARHLGRGSIVDPEFSLYRRHLTEIDPDAPRWRSNPSNPLGRLAGAGEVAGVWDEAFYPLATGRWTRGDDTAWRLGSLTKLWNCPGLRLGYAIAPSAAGAQAVRAAQPTWAVNGLALALLPLLLDCTDLPGWADLIASTRRAFAVDLVDLGFTVTDTDVNWVLVDGQGLRDRLAPQGVVIRDCASFGMPGRFRVAVPFERDRERVLAAFGGASTATGADV